ncbi:MAG: helix-hairpin-helix domain-containing protein [Candidatus Dojkabacteria bacterium]|jgi:competence protein ComEA|nr:helix-hairpin-helix domain-containing protein [Candidatus Dojkabacteria bacterium]
MGSKVKVKNISILFLFFCLGYISNILVLNWGEIDIYQYISKLREESVITEIEENIVVEKEICEPEVVIEEEIDTCPILVDISGAVKTPGVYCFEKGSSVVDAVKKAKGFTLDAGFKYISMRINLATVMIDNSKIYIPFEIDYDCKLLTFNLPKDVIDITIPDIEDDEEDTQQPSECISINTATQQELETLSGVGPSTALKIVGGRPYTVLEDLLNVSGIGDATFNAFKDSICL